MADPLTLLWIDLRVSREQALAVDQFVDFFSVRCCSEQADLAVQVKAASPDAIVVDFDYPDRAGLRLMQDLKARYPKLPILMITVQHSEELAVWAFRSGVLDYLVKPVPRADLMRVRNRLVNIREMKRPQRSRSLAHAANELPPEAAPVQRSGSRSLAPAIHYVATHFRDKIARDEAARLCAMSPFRFSRYFKEVHGIGFREYVVRFRIREACRLLERPGASVTDVAFAVGFQDASYFSRIYKQYLGISPSEQRKSCDRSDRPAAGKLLPDMPVQPEAAESAGELFLPVPDMIN